MANETAIRLLIIDNSKNDAEAYNSAILSMGQALRSLTMSDNDDFEKVFASHQPDLILINLKNTLMPFKSLMPMIHNEERKIPVILICDKDTDISLVDAIKTGARDRVIKTDLEHLKLVVKREYQSINLLSEIGRLKKAYNDTEVRCHNLLDNSRDAIAYVHEGMHVYANKSYLETFGFDSFEDIEGLPILDMVSAKQQPDFKKFFRSLNGTDNTNQALETELKNTDNSTFKGKIEFGSANIDGEPCIEILIRKQIDSKALEEQINKLSKLDTLTGLMNRLSFIEEFESKIPHVSATAPLVLYKIGIDKFKDIQDTVGLVGSDQVIAEMAGIIKKSLGKTHIASRYEGCHYLMLTDHKNEKFIHAYAEKILERTSNHICDVEGKSINMQCSIGASIIDDETLDAIEVISRTEKAFLSAANDGNMLEVYRPKEGEMTQKQLDTVWANNIRTALDKNRFNLLFQPIVQLDDSSIERYEVTVEMLDENNEPVKPSRFLPAAERTQMSKIIDRWVISNSFKQLVKHLKTAPNTVFFIKLTGGSLEDTQLFRWISDRIKEHSLPRGKLIFEVKEEAVISHLRQAQAFATLLKTIHCGFAIDDFGTGPEPFKLLEHIPAQFLKFDKQFTQDLAKNKQNQDTMTSITEKAKALKKHTIVQRVEDAATLSVLWTIGANYLQGNFFQGPSHQMDYDFSAGMG